MTTFYTQHILLVVVCHPLLLVLFLSLLNFPKILVLTLVCFATLFSAFDQSIHSHAATPLHTNCTTTTRSPLSCRITRDTVGFNQLCLAPNGTTRSSTCVSDDKKQSPRSSTIFWTTTAHEDSQTDTQYIGLVSDWEAKLRLLLKENEKANYSACVFRNDMYYYVRRDWSKHCGEQEELCDCAAL